MLNVGRVERIQHEGIDGFWFFEGGAHVVVDELDGFGEIFLSGFGVGDDEFLLCEFAAGGHADFVFLGVDLDEVQTFAEGGTDTQLLEEDQGVSHSVAPLLEQFEHVLQEVFLLDRRGHCCVQGEILVHPYFALAELVHGYHASCHLEGAQSVEQTFVAYEYFLDKVEYFYQREVFEVCESEGVGFVSDFE